MLLPSPCRVLCLMHMLPGACAASSAQFCVPCVLACVRACACVGRAHRERPAPTIHISTFDRSTCMRVCHHSCRSFLLLATSHSSIILVVCIFCHARPVYMPLAPTPHTVLFTTVCVAASQAPCVLSCRAASGACSNNWRQARSTGTYPEAFCRWMLAVPSHTLCTNTSFWVCVRSACIIPPSHCVPHLYTKSRPTSRFMCFQAVCTWGSENSC